VNLQIAAKLSFAVPHCKLISHLCAEFAQLNSKRWSSHETESCDLCPCNIASSHIRPNWTQLNPTVVTVGDNAMASFALWRHGLRVIC